MAVQCSHVMRLSTTAAQH